MVGLYGLLMVLVLAMLLVVGSLTIAKDFFQGQNQLVKAVKECLIWKI